MKVLRRITFFRFFLWSLFLLSNIFIIYVDVYNHEYSCGKVKGGGNDSKRMLILK